MAKTQNDSALHGPGGHTVPSERLKPFTHSMRSGRKVTVTLTFNDREAPVDRLLSH